nr:hypothetical protein [Klebsiella pneumoniae subsp. pneumoniae]
MRFGQLLVMPGWFSHLMALLPAGDPYFGLKNARGAWRPIFPPRESAR